MKMNTFKVRAVLIVLFLVITLLPTNASGESFVSSKLATDAQELIVDFLNELKSMDKASQHYSNMEIMEFVNLYDKKDQVIGSTAILSDNKESGYITAVLVNDVLTVTEFSSDSELVLPEGKLYYFGLLEFCFKDSMGNFINVDTKMRITPPSGNHIQKELYDMQNVELMTNSTSVYLPNSMTFISQQPYTNACVAASSAMILQYWKEHKGYSAISQSGSSLFNTLKSSTYIGTGSAGLSDFYYGTKSYIENLPGSHTMGAITQCSWTPSGWPVLTDNMFSTVSSNIAYDRPSLVIAGQLSYPGVSGTTLHAMPVIGVIQGSTNYLVCRDPYKTYSNSVTVLWHPANDDPNYFWIYGVSSGIGLY